MKLKAIYGLLLIGLTVIALSRVTFANSKYITPTGLTVSPAIENLTTQPQQLSDTYNITLTNNSSSAVQIFLSAQDFISASSSNSIDLIKSQLPASTHGLANWITFPVQLSRIAARSSVSLPIIITKINMLAPGGHYAAVMVRVIPGSLDMQSNSLASKQIIASLLFLTTAGRSLTKIQLQPLDLGWLKFNLPRSINLVFRNSGNIQVAPRGLVVVSSFNGAEVARGLININSGLLLPQTSALFNTSLSSENTLNFPGIYTATVSYRPSNSSLTRTISEKFLYISTPVAIGIGLIIFAGVVLLIRRSGINYKYIFRR